MKKVLKFSNFSNIFKKRAYSTPHAPKLTNENFQKMKIFNFFENFHLWVWGVGSTVSAFSNIFRNFENFKTLFIPLIRAYYACLLSYADPKIDKNRQFSQIMKNFTPKWLKMPFSLRLLRVDQGMYNHQSWRFRHLFGKFAHF